MVNVFNHKVKFNVNFCFVNCDALWVQVSEWMKQKGVCIFSATEHAVQLDLIGRVRGFLEAEKYFNDLRDQDKTDKTYGALLNCYVHGRQSDLCLSHFEKMKELGFASSTLTYNDIMCLYTNLGQCEKVPDVLEEMKENQVFPDNFSYRICMNSYGKRSDVEGMERVLKEMEGQTHIVMDWNSYAVAANFYIKAGLTDKATYSLKKAEETLDKKDALGYNNLISLHAKLGNKEEVLRLWTLEKSACKRYINRDFMVMLDSLVRLGAMEEAEEVLKEWESSGNCHDFRVPSNLIDGYSEKGLYGKAEALLEDMMEKGKSTTPNSWGKVAAGYLDRGETEKAFKCMKAAFLVHLEKVGKPAVLDVHMKKEWKPNHEVIYSLLRWLSDTGSVEEVETFVGSMKTVIPMNRTIYHALLKARIRGGLEINSLLDAMKTDNVDEDEETMNILAMKQN